jgi:Tol biopolymer transport system component
VLSGNGARIAFQSSADLTGGNAVNQAEVFVIDWGGSNLRQLTATTAVLGILGDPTSQLPSITDDGLSIFYHSNQSSLFPFVNIDGNFEIFRIQADGTGRTQLTSTILDGGSALVTVSGDGSRMTYYGIGVSISLKVEAVSGAEETELLLFDPVFSDQPAVSPDGTRIVFVRTDGLFGGGQLWTVARDGSGTAQVTALASGSPSSPAVAGDNATVLFAADSDPTGANADGSTEIFSIGIDGAGISAIVGLEVKAP